MNQFLFFSLYFFIITTVNSKSNFRKQINIPVEQVADTQIPVVQPSIEQVPINTLVDQPLVVQAPVNQVPIIQAPVDQPSVVQAPVNQVPVIQTPINQVPIIQTPLYQPSIVQTPIDQTIHYPNHSPQILPLTSEWSQSSIIAQDVGVSPEGDIYVVGIDGRLYKYDFAFNTYLKIVSEPDLDTITRVSVDQDGTPYVVTSCGATYYLSCENKWVQLPGCATDIGVGFCGHVWKTGCDARKDGFGIWKLICTGKEKKCARFQKSKSNSCNQRSEKRDCNWYRVNGSGIRIDVFSDGKPAIIQADGQAKKYDGDNWNLITQYRGRDISVSNEDMVIMSGGSTGIYFIPKKKQEETSEEYFDPKYGFTVYDPENVFVPGDNDSELDLETKFIDVGCTMSISSGPFSQPVCIPCASEYSPVLILTQKFNYN